MSIDLLIGLALVVGMLGYLAFALLFPERF